MLTSYKLTPILFELVVLATLSLAVSAADPGSAYLSQSEASDQKAGSLLIFNYYSSDSANPAVRDSRINVNNTSPNNSAILHLFFVTQRCDVADFKTYLTPNQTFSFLVSDFDPDVTGYIMVVAENAYGLPVSHNFLTGDEYFKDVEFTVNLGAVAFSALFTGPIGDAFAPTVIIDFNGRAGGYNRLPATLALSNIPSRAANDRTALIINTIGGNYLTNTGTGATLFGILYDDAEQAQSFSLVVNCQYVRILDDNNPRTVPRFSTVIPAGRTGWMRLYSPNGTVGILGAMLVWNRMPGNNYMGAHNLHHLTLDADGQSAILPVFPF